MSVWIVIGRLFLFVLNSRIPHKSFRRIREKFIPVADSTRLTICIRMMSSRLVRFSASLECESAQKNRENNCATCSVVVVVVILLGIRTPCGFMQIAAVL